MKRCPYPPGATEQLKGESVHTEMKNCMVVKIMIKSWLKLWQRQTLRRVFNKQNKINRICFYQEICLSLPVNHGHYSFPTFFSFFFFWSFTSILQFAQFIQPPLHCDFMILHSSSFPQPQETEIMTVHVLSGDLTAHRRGWEGMLVTTSSSNPWELWVHGYFNITSYRNAIWLQTCECLRPQGVLWRRITVRNHKGHQKPATFSD